MENTASSSGHDDIEAGVGALGRVTLLQPGDSSEAIYDDWAATYEADLTRYGYLSPALCAEALSEMLLDHTRFDVAVVDYGCGTGLAGVELARVGLINITGIDLSQGMLDVARTKSVLSLIHI